MTDTKRPDLPCPWCMGQIRHVVGCPSPPFNDPRWNERKLELKMAKETPKQMEKRLELEVLTREVAAVVDSLLPEGIGFMMFLARTNPEGHPALGYAANIERESTIEILKLYLDDWGANQ